MSISVCPEEPMDWNDLSAKVTTTSYELCRNFAAILQMANEGKVVFGLFEVFVTLHVSRSRFPPIRATWVISLSKGFRTVIENKWLEIKSLLSKEQELKLPRQSKERVLILFTLPSRLSRSNSVKGTTVDSPSIPRRSKPKKKQRRK